MLYDQHKSLFQMFSFDETGVSSQITKCVWLTFRPNFKKLKI